MTERLEAMLAKGTDNMLLRFSLGKAYAEQDCYGDAETSARGAGIRSRLFGGLEVAGQGLPGAGRQGRRARGLGVRPGSSAARGDQQVVKELQVFMKRLDKQA